MSLAERADAVKARVWSVRRRNVAWGLSAMLVSRRDVWVVLEKGGIGIGIVFVNLWPVCGCNRITQKWLSYLCNEMYRYILLVED
jgi:hypothetical protein